MADEKLKCISCKNRITGRSVARFLCPNCGKVEVTIKIMPESPEISFSQIQESAKAIIKDFSGSANMKTEEQPIAFGLKALIIRFVMDEAKGSTEPLENNLKNIEGVMSVETTDVRRAIG